MLNKSSTVNQGAKISFTDFMQMSIAERKSYFKKQSNNRLHWRTTY